MEYISLHIQALLCENHVKQYSTCCLVHIRCDLHELIHWMVEDTCKDEIFVEVCLRLQKRKRRRMDRLIIRRNGKSI